MGKQIVKMGYVLYGGKCEDSNGWFLSKSKVR